MGMRVSDTIGLLDTKFLEFPTFADSVGEASHVVMVRNGSRLCENVLEPRMHRIVFSIVVSQRKLLVQLVSASTKLRQMFYTQIERRLFTQPGSN